MNLPHLDVPLEDIYLSLMESIDDYIYIGDLSTNTFFISSNMAADFDLPGQVLEDLVGVWGKLVSPQDQNRYFKSIKDMLDGITDIHNEEYQVMNRQGHYIWVHCKGRIHRDPATGAPRSFAGVVKNPENMGRIDHVTGLFTHEKFHEHAALLNQDSESLSPGGFIMLGIDDFSRINTLNDHHFGDLVLRNTAQQIQPLLPYDACIYRFDGDQFGILSKKSDKEELIALYLTIRHSLSRPRVLNNIEYEFTISGGIVPFSENGLSSDNMVKYASIALKAAKSAGKDQCALFSNDLLDHKIREQQILQLMTESVRNNFEKFELYYQPILNTATFQVYGAEALLRFHSKEYGKLSPVEFIPLLESSRLIIPVGTWILRNAFATCKKWVASVPDFVLNVNVSCIQLVEPDFPYLVEALLKEYDLEPFHINLEMTESYFVTHEDLIESSLKYLCSLGVKIAMDDFGTGYSSLGRLTQFHVNTIKIDRLFVESLNDNRYNKEFIDSVIRLCHSAGMSVCVEGIETADEMNAICDMKPDSLQGFYLSKPKPAKEFMATFIQNPACLSSYRTKSDKPAHYQRLSGDKDLLFQLLDASPICLTLWNKHFELIECNRASVELFGLKNEAEYIENFFRLSPAFQPDGTPSAKAVIAYIDETLRTGKKHFHWIHQNLAGDLIPVDATLVRMKYENDYVIAGYLTPIKE